MLTIKMFNKRGEKSHTIRLEDYQEAALYDFLNKQSWVFIDEL